MKYSPALGRTAKALTLALSVSSISACAAINLPLTTLDTQASAVQSYAYGFPALLMQQTKTAMTGSEPVCEFASSVGQFKHIYEVPGPDFRAVVRPNVDTLYSSAFLELSRGAVKLDMPAIKDRYVLKVEGKNVKLSDLEDARDKVKTRKLQ